jgi:hypothetical protein
VCGSSTPATAFKSSARLVDRPRRAQPREAAGVGGRDRGAGLDLALGERRRRRVALLGLEGQRGALEQLQLEPLAPALAQLGVGGRRRQLVAVELHRLDVVEIERRASSSATIFSTTATRAVKCAAPSWASARSPATQLVVELLGAGRQRVAIGREQEQLAGIEAIQVRREGGLQRRRRRGGGRSGDRARGGG